MGFYSRLLYFSIYFVRWAAYLNAFTTNPATATINYFEDKKKIGIFVIGNQSQYAVMSLKAHGIEDDKGGPFSNVINVVNGVGKFVLSGTLRRLGNKQLRE